MASIATVVTMGYGSFGSVNLLPTIGYGIGSTVGGAQLCGDVTMQPLLTGRSSITQMLAGTTVVTPLLTGTTKVSECE